jgi:hypothetical protein
MAFVSIYMQYAPHLHTKLLTSCCEAQAPNHWVSLNWKRKVAAFTQIAQPAFFFAAFVDMVG